MLYIVNIMNDICSA